MARRLPTNPWKTAEPEPPDIPAALVRAMGAAISRKARAPQAVPRGAGRQGGVRHGSARPGGNPLGRRIPVGAGRNPGKFSRPPGGNLVQSAYCINIHVSCIIPSSLKPMEASL